MAGYPARNLRASAVLHSCAAPAACRGGHRSTRHTNTADALYTLGHPVVWVAPSRAVALSRSVSARRACATAGATSAASIRLGAVAARAGRRQNRRSLGSGCRLGPRFGSVLPHGFGARAPHTNSSAWTKIGAIGKTRTTQHNTQPAQHSMRNRHTDKHTDTTGNVQYITAQYNTAQHDTMQKQTNEQTYSHTGKHVVRQPGTYITHTRT